MAAQWPLVLNRLLTLLPTLDGWQQVKMFDGPPVDDNVTGLYCTVGYVEGDSSGSYSQQRDQSGGRLVEVGEVKCQLVCQEQRNDLAGTRDRAFPLIDALEASLRADYTFGVLGGAATTGVTSEILQQQTASGPFVSVVFTFSYSTIT